MHKIGVRIENVAHARLSVREATGGMPNLVHDLCNCLLDLEPVNRNRLVTEKDIQYAQKHERFLERIDLQFKQISDDRARFIAFHMCDDDELFTLGRVMDSIAKCDLPVTDVEIEGALDQLKLHSSPGEGWRRVLFRQPGAQVATVEEAVRQHHEAAQAEHHKQRCPAPREELTMTRLLTQEPSAFVYSRPVRITDACFVPSVYHQNGKTLNETRLLGALTSLRPLSVAASPAQGKASLVSFMEALVGGTQAACWLPFRAPDAACPSSGAWLDRLSKELEGPARTATLDQAARTALAKAALARLRDEEATTVILLLDLTSCRIPDLTEWVMGRISIIGREVDLLAMRLQLVVVTGHSQLDPSYAPHFADRTGAITIANFTAAQSDELLNRAAFGNPAIEFDAGARAATFLHARGDKYFTNFLAALCARLAQRSVRRGDLLVNETLSAPHGQPAESFGVGRDEPDPARLRPGGRRARGRGARAGHALRGGR